METIAKIRRDYYVYGKALRRISAEGCLSLKDKAVSLHTLQHTTAMDLLHSGVGGTLIALWLGA